jgi:hypothetical protein
MSQLNRMTLTGASNEPYWVAAGVLLAAANGALAVVAASHPWSVVPVALTFAVGYLGAAVIVPVRRWRRAGSLVLMGLAGIALFSWLYSIVFHLDWTIRPENLLRLALDGATLFVGRRLFRTDNSDQPSGVLAQRDRPE